MKWRGRRQSKNFEDATLDPLPDIPDGTQMLNDPDPEYRWQNNAKEGGSDQTNKQRQQQINAERDVMRRKDNVPTPTSRPEKIQVTPGKWVTKKKKK